MAAVGGDRSAKVEDLTSLLIWHDSLVCDWYLHLALLLSCWTMACMASWAYIRTYYLTYRHTDIDLYTNHNSMSLVSHEMNLSIITVYSMYPSA